MYIYIKLLFFSFYNFKNFHNNIIMDCYIILFSKKQRSLFKKCIIFKNQISKITYKLKVIDPDERSGVPCTILLLYSHCIFLCLTV